MSNSILVTNIKKAVNKGSVIARATVRIGSVTIKQVKLVKKQNGEHFVSTPRYKYRNTFFSYVDISETDATEIKNQMINWLAKAA